LTVWWDTLPPSVQLHSVVSGAPSNIHPADYVGPEVCKDCHPRNYESWSKHSHRWMNALASEATVRGDFSGRTISYKGGQATFYSDAGKYFMRLERGEVRRLYAVTQTIGSRFFQYYVGKQIQGPEPQGHRFYTRDQVLYLGYWLAQKEWVPIVHVGPERPDDERPDPFAPPEQGRHYADYAVGCNCCHTTFPLGDLLGRRADVVGTHAPVALHWSLGKYLEETHADLYASLAPVVERGQPVRGNPMDDWEAPRYAATLGVSVKPVTWEPGPMSPAAARYCPSFSRPARTWPSRPRRRG
jgi:hypothetical protein